jgi:hypothetical protein
MIRQCLQITLLIGTLVGRWVPVVLAEGAVPVPQSRGVVATITTIDARTGLVTLQTETGEAFELPKGWRWKVGDRLECDRIEVAPRPRLQNCKPW